MPSLKLAFHIREADGSTRLANLGDLVGALTLDTVRYTRQGNIDAGVDPGKLAPGAFIVDTGDGEKDIAWADYFNEITTAKPEGSEPVKRRPADLVGDTPPPAPPTRQPKTKLLSNQYLLDFYGGGE